MASVPAMRMLKRPLQRCLVCLERHRTSVRFLSKTLQSSRSRCSHPHLIFRQKLPTFARAPIAFFSDLPEHFKIKLPALSPTMEMGTLVKWEKREGDHVSEGDLLAEIETDKATMGFETPEDGYIAKIFIPEGSKDVPLGKLLCVIVPEEDGIAAFKDYKPTAEDDASPIAAVPSSAAQTPQPVATPESAPKEVRSPAASDPPIPPSPPPTPVATSVPPAAPTPVSATPGKRALATPMARRMALDRNIDLSTVVGSGPGGQIRVEDLASVQPRAPTSPITAPAVTLAVSTPAVAPTAAEAPSPLPVGTAFVDIPLSNMRQIIAKRLLQSKTTIPHYYLNIDVNMDRIFSLRRKLNENLKKDNKKLSVNDFIIKASALACLKVPETNSSWMETFIRQHSNCDVSVAVATDAGLITPIVFGANNKGLVEIGQTVSALAEKARQGKLQPHEFQGGTFTISNLGMFGVHSFSAIINPPQSCILAVGTTRKRIIVDDNPDSETGYRSADVMTVTLSCDHRVVDGAVGARWMTEFKALLEQPYNMLL